MDQLEVTQWCGEPILEAQPPFCLLPPVGEL